MNRTEVYPLPNYIIIDAADAEIPSTKSSVGKCGISGGQDESKISGPRSVAIVTLPHTIAWEDAENGLVANIKEPLRSVTHVMFGREHLQSRKGLKTVVLLSVI